MDACSSIDPDSLSVKFNYRWACERTTVDTAVDTAVAYATSLPCFSDTEGLLAAYVLTLTLPKKTLQGGMNELTATVSKEKGVGQVKQSTASLLVDVRVGVVEESYVQQGAEKKRNPVRWSVVDGAFDEADPKKRGSAMDSSELVLNLNQQCAFNFKATNPSDMRGTFELTQQLDKRGAFAHHSEMRCAVTSFELDILQCHLPGTKETLGAKEFVDNKLTLWATTSSGTASEGKGGTNVDALKFAVA